MNLRPYQRKAIDSIYRYWKEGNKSPGIIIAPTGSGKSIIIAQFIKEILEDFPDAQFLILTHVQELVKQDHDELFNLWPEAPLGIFSAGLGRKDFQAQILFASVQSIEKHCHRLDPVPHIVIIDECHLIPRNENTRYRRTLETLSLMYPQLKVVGLTATNYRLDSGYLHKGDGAFFDKIIFEIDVQFLIDQGFLAPVTPYGSSIRIDTSSVHKVKGEYKIGELEAAAMQNDTTERAIDDVIARAGDRKKWLLFACGVKHAQEICLTLEKKGISCDVVLGSTPKIERERIIKAYKVGMIKALVNVDVLTTGFNVPEIDLLVMLRPTESAGLYVQMVGRGMRKAQGKTDCLLLDYAGVCVRHGPIDAVDPDRNPSSGGGVAPAKECPQCWAIIAAGCKVCPACGHEFPPNELKIHHRPSSAPVLKSQIKPQAIEVRGQRFSIHKKQGRPDSIKISYDCGLLTVNEWIFPESENDRGQYYYGVFCDKAGITPRPATSREFLSRATECRCPISIFVVKEGKYDKVTSRVYE